MIVRTTAGSVQGIARGDTFGFLGVPYAAPPVGANRLLAPAPVAPWDGVRAATAYGATAFQPDQEFTLIPEPKDPGDDFLNLNVFTPDPGAAGLPVLVWIHGGGFTQGCGNSTWYAGDQFCRDGIVTVAINYRLGAEGFAVIDGAPTNRAVRDWIAALEWVRDNIAAFGGDPSQVTIGGQSAGAAACVTLMTAPGARGLFRNVIAMSGSAGNVAPITAARVPATAQRLADQIGVECTRDGFAACSPWALIDAQIACGTTWDGPPMHYAPVAGDDVVPELPHDAIARGEAAEVGLLIGATRDEARPLFLLTGQKFDDDRMRRHLGRTGLDDAAIAAYRAALPGFAPWEVMARARSDTTFRLPGLRLARARGGAPTFHYDFAWESPALGGVGAGHCVDVPFVFDVLGDAHAKTVLGDSAPQSLADTVHAAFVAFVKGDQPWPLFDESEPTMVFDGNGARIETSVLATADAAFPSTA
ncbi:MAG: carboxylesterase family protein [Acidimicrobiales bacterium]|nr:carboxylesterase family protein [Acidimicrobiales bacterium]